MSGLGDLFYEEILEDIKTGNNNKNDAKGISNYNLMHQILKGKFKKFHISIEAMSIKKRGSDKYYSPWFLFNLDYDSKDNSFKFNRSIFYDPSRMGFYDEEGVITFLEPKELNRYYICDRLTIFDCIKAKNIIVYIRVNDL